MGHPSCGHHLNSQYLTLENTYIHTYLIHPNVICRRWTKLLYKPLCTCWHALSWHWLLPHELHTSLVSTWVVEHVDLIIYKCYSAGPSRRYKSSFVIFFFIYLIMILLKLTMLLCKMSKRTALRNMPTAQGQLTRFGIVNSLRSNWKLSPVFNNRRKPWFRCLFHGKHISSNTIRQDSFIFFN